ncbi:S-layer homology domain-containing protein [Cohnella sp. 56]|uniref:S-layer homology domain-containing protein n=1 Tax=Cohnella sp. 56 TaxID=3113722 RepID=UPI0030E8E05C
MYKRSWTSILALLLSLAIAMPVSAGQTGEDDGLQAPDGVVVTPQELPLPANESESVSVNSVTYALRKESPSIQIKTSDGTNIAGAGEAFVNGHSVAISDGNIDLSGLSFNPDTRVEVVFAVQTDRADMYLDSFELSWGQLAAMNEWIISSQSVHSTMQTLPLSGGVPFIYEAGFKGHIFQIGAYNDSFTLITRPSELVLSAWGQSGRNGYLLSKSITVSGGEIAPFTDADIANAFSLTLPAGNKFAALRNSFAHAEFVQADQLKVSAGTYDTVVQTVDNGGYRSVWGTEKLNLQADQTLSFSKPVLRLLKVNSSEQRFSSSLEVRNGDFQLYGVYAEDDAHINLIQNGLHITNDKQAVQYDKHPQSNEWSYINAAFSPKLKTGLYKAEVSITYPGLADPLVETNAFRIENPDDYKGKGLHIAAENEAGDALSGGYAVLYRALPLTPYYLDAENGTLSNYTSQVGYWDLDERGAAIIPYDYLMQGLDYELVIIGNSAGGRPGVVYATQVNRADKELRLTASKLKHVKLQAEQATSGDTLVMSLLDEQGEPSSYPWAIPFVGKSADVWINADQKLDFFTKLHDGDNGYFLDKQMLPPSADSVIDLNGDMVEIALPSGYKGQLDVNYIYYTGSNEAKRYYVTKGVDAVAYFDIDKDGYRYSFAKYLGAVNEKKTLNFGSTFTNRTPEQNIYWSGAVNQKVYTDYWDAQDNLLIGVSTLEAAKIASSITQESIAFKVDEGGAMRTLAIRPASEGFGYMSIGYNDASSAAVASNGLLDYQIYDSANQPVGTPFSVMDMNSFWLNTRLPAGQYKVRLISQNFPKSLISLEGQSVVNVMDPYGSSDIIEIPIEYPLQYPASSGGFDAGNGYVALQQEGESQIIDISSISYGKIVFWEASKIEANQRYVIHMMFNWQTPMQSISYYSRTTVSGADLLAKKEIKRAAHTKALDLKFDNVPANLQGDHASFTFASPNGTNPFTIAHSAIRTSRTSATMSTLITSETDFAADLYGVDGGSGGYDLRKQVHLDAGIDKWSINDRPLFELQLQQGHPFYGITSPSNYYSAYNLTYNNASTILNKVYVPAGTSSYRISTPVYSEDERAWYLDWRTRSDVTVAGNTTIAFTGRVDSSSLSVVQTAADGATVLNIVPELVSGDLKLVSAQSGNRSLYQYAPSIVTIRDSKNKKVYAGVAYGADQELTLTKKLDSGDYTLTYLMPTGPNQSVTLSKSFAVSANGESSGGSTGGGSPGGSTGSGGGSGAGSQGAEGANSPKTAIFKTADIPAAVDGVVTLQIKDSEAIKLPASILSGEGAKNTLEIAGNHGKVSIPAAVLQQLAGLVGKNALAEAQIMLSLAPLSASELSAAVKAKAGTSVKAAGSIYDFKLSIQAKDGQESVLSAFSEPITLTFEVNASAEKRLANVFYIAEDGSLTYVPSKWSGGMLVAKVTHFSKYGVLELRKTFTDMSQSHWAREAVEELAAKQIVSGTTEDTFAPSRTVTRAEFTAMLVNALALQTDKKAVFKDVPGTAWYASAVAAAYESGLVKGAGQDTFAPGRAISREEMAVIMAGALKLAQPEATAGQAASFKDATKISAWAREAVNEASAYGLIKGDGSGGFNPKGLATRAEAAQMLVNLLRLASQ